MAEDEIVLMVIFGAGASYDSSVYYPPHGSPVSANRPPLANELFGERYFTPYHNVYPECIPIVPHLLPSGRPTWSIERALQTLQDGADRDPRRHSQLAAVRYYLRRMIEGLSLKWLGETHRVTNYAALVDMIEHSRPRGEIVCLVTFNYDTLAEHTLREINYPIGCLADYVCGPRFKLFKLHGSSNWGQHLEGNVPHEVVPIRPGEPWTFEHQIIAAAPTLIANGCISERYSLVGFLGPPYSADPLYPAIAIPVTSKQRFVCPADHLSMLDSLLPEVDRVLMVGWRAQEHHFLAKLRLIKPSAMAAIAGSLNEAQQTLTDVTKAGVPFTSLLSLVTFSGAVTDPELHRFLEGDAPT